MYVSVGKHKIQVLLDTGASVSDVSQNAVQTYLPHNQQLHTSPLPNVKAVGGYTVQILACLILYSLVGTLPVQHTFYVLENMNYSLILGVDFLNAQTAELSFAKNRLILRDGQNNCQHVSPSEHCLM